MLKYPFLIKDGCVAVFLFLDNHNSSSGGGAAVSTKLNMI